MRICILKAFSRDSDIAGLRAALGETDEGKIIIPIVQVSRMRRKEIQQLLQDRAAQPGLEPAAWLQDCS